MLEIIHHPNPILVKESQVITDFSGLSSLVASMAEVMYGGLGVGLAAPQVGVLQRLVLVDPSGGESALAMRVMVNPVVEFASPEKEMGAEGCLSLPGTNILVLRSKMINVSYVDLEGTRTTEILTGLEARIAQHEIDHLNGITLLKYVKKFHAPKGNRR